MSTGEEGKEDDELKHVVQSCGHISRSLFYSVAQEYTLFEHGVFLVHLLNIEGLETRRTQTPQTANPHCILILII